jgi:hypothetical protein
MNPPPRSPPSVLFIHNGAPSAAHLDYLVKAGLCVSDIHADGAIDEAVARQSDIIVLDFALDAS